MSGTFKKIVIGLVAVGAIAIVIIFAGGSKDEGNLVSSTPSSTTDTPIGDSSITTGEFLTKLLNIRNIELNDKIFFEPGFAILKDSSIQLIQDEKEGRSNPFAPIGFENTPVSASVISTTPTSSSPTSSSGTSPSSGNKKTN